LPDELEVGRYHSWVIREEGFPEELEVTARDENNMIMALRHKSLDVQGVQFHPESVLTAGRADHEELAVAIEGLNGSGVAG